MDKLPISLCTFVKNEEGNLRDCLESVRPIVSEIVVVDTGSTDGTVELAKKYTDRVYQVQFSDFGSIRTLTAHLATQPWVLMLDADERLAFQDWPLLAELIDQPVGVKGDDMELTEDGQVIIDSWALPRKRWADPWMRKQVDVEAYPDWQVRLFRNHTNRPKIKFVRRVHERVSGCIRTEQSIDGPVIHHFQNVQKDQERLAERQSQYTVLQAADIAEGVAHEVPAVIDRDKVNEDG